jgi:UDP-glucuronate 4-epimerase
MALFKFVDRMLNDQPIEIYGEGRMSRDFTYIDDLVEAILRLSHVAPDESNRVADERVETLSREAPFRVVNIGGGQPENLLDFVDIVEKAIGRPAKRQMLPMQQGDVPRTFASPALMQALTGYTPSTRLEEGVKAFVEWYLDARSELQ